MRDKELPRQAKIKEIYHKKNSSTRNAEETYLNGKVMTTNRDKRKKLSKRPKTTRRKKQAIKSFER